MRLVIYNLLMQGIPCELRFTMFVMFDAAAPKQHLRRRIARVRSYNRPPASNKQRHVRLKDGWAILRCQVGRAAARQGKRIDGG